ncbi:MAG: filamentous hemagglutinin N-terminal domain-containing protein, partial [Pseudomonadota bacterium]
MIGGDFQALSEFHSKIDRLRARLLGKTALCGAVSLGVLFGASNRHAEAGPEGTKVTHGKVSIQKSGTHTEFTQSTNKAILTHKSFDIKANESVNFAQPSKNALAVNRVIGKDLPTNIAGQLTANGNVWVINPSGVAISSTAQVNVNGLIATTASISDQDILSGRTSFAGAPDGSAVTIAGEINAGDGSVVLVAPVVENTGTITTQGSDIALGAGSGFTVDFEGDGLTRFEVTPASGVSLTNTGTLSAQGGAAYISAESADDVQTSVVSIGGRVEATRIEDKGGVIVISGGDNGVTEITGEIDASQTTGDGGSVAVTGDKVAIRETARIDASGAESGGKIEIGGGFQGAAIESPVVRRVSAPSSAPVPTAKRTLVEAGAVITANAGETGDGGEVIVWADEITSFSGQIEAKGGFLSGNGGFAEVSGKIHLAFEGNVDLSAADGSIGTLLLDPQNLFITDAISENDVDLPDILFDDVDADEDFFVTAATLNQQTAAVTLQATNNIQVDSTVNSTQDLTFEASNNIVLNDSITTSGNLTLTADADSSSSTVTGASAPDGDGTIVFGTGSPFLDASDIQISTGEAVELGDITAATLTVSSGGDVTQQAGTSVTTSGLASFNADAAAITLTETANSFGSIAADTDLADDGGEAAVQITDSGAVVLGVIDASDLTITAGGNVTQDGDTLTAVTVADVTSITATGFDVTLTESTTDLGDAGLVGDVNVTAANFTLVNADALTLGAVTLSSNLDVTTEAGNIFDDNNASISVTGTSSLTAAGNVNISSDGHTLTGAVSVDGNSLARITSDVALDLASADANSIDVTSGGAVTVGALDAVNVTVVAGGAVTQDGDTVTGVAVSGASTISAAGFDVTFDEDGTDLGSTIDVTAQNFELANTDGLALGAVALTGSLSLSAGAAATDTITDETGDISVAGTTTLSTGDAITIDDAGNTFTGAVDLDSDNTIVFTADSALTVGNATSADVTINSGGTVALGTIATDSLSVTAGGAVTSDSATSVSVSGNSTFTAIGFDVTLDQGIVALGDGNGFDLIDVSADDFTLDNANDIDLGEISLTGDLSLSTGTGGGDNIADGGGDISVAGATTLNAENNININDTTGNTFVGAVSISADRVTSLTSDAALVLGTVTTTDNNQTNLFDSASSVEFTGVYTDGTNSDLTVQAESTITQASGATIVTDLLTLDAIDTTNSVGQNITLTDAGNDANTLTVTNAGTLSFTDDTDISLNIQNTGDTTITADDVGIVGVNIGTSTLSLISTGGDVGFGVASASGFEINDAEIALITADEVSVTSNDSAISVGADATGIDLVTLDAGAGDITIAEASDFVSLSASGANFRSEATNTLTASDTASISVTGEVSLDAPLTADTLNVDAGTDFVVDNTDDLLTVTTVGNITVGGDADFEQINAATLNVEVGDDVIFDAAATVSGVLSITETSGGNFDLFQTAAADGDSEIQFGDLANSDIATLRLTTDGGTISTAAADFSGVETIDLIATGAGAVTVTGLTHDLVAGGDIAIDAGSGAVVFNTTASSVNDLTVSAADNITQGVGVTVAGTADLTTTNAVTLADVTNDFNTVSATGTTVTLADANDIALGAVTATDLDVTSAGGRIATSQNISITDGNIILTAENGLSLTGNVTTTNTAASTITGNITLTSDSDNDGGDFIFDGDITLDAANDLVLASGAGAFTDGNAGTATLIAAGAIQLPSISFTDSSLTVTSGGGITQEANSALLIAGSTSLTAGDAITLTEDNDFDIDGSGDGVSAVADGGGAAVSLTDVSGIVLGEISASDLTVVADGSITDTGGSAISVSGTASLSASDGATAFHDIVLDNDVVTGGRHTISTLLAAGEDITLETTGALDLAGVTTNADGAADGTIAGAAGDLVLSAGGAVTDSAAVTVAGSSVWSSVPLLKTKSAGSSRAP